MKVRDLFNMIWRRFWIVIAITTIITAAIGVYSYRYITPMYAATVELLVMPNPNEARNQSREIDFNEIQTSLKLMDTYQVIIKSPRVLEKTIASMNSKLSPDELDSKTTVKPVKSSQVISITVSDPSYTIAVEIANRLARISVEEIKGIVKIDNIQVISEAKVKDSPNPVSPRPLLNIAMALVIGFFFSIAAILLYESCAVYKKTRNIQKKRMINKSAIG